MAYITPLHRPSSIRHAIPLSFLHPDSLDLVVAKANRLDIYSPSPQDPTQLLLHHTTPIYGQITLLEKLRPATSPTDHLFVGTDRYHYFTLSWDADAKHLRTEKSYVDIADKAARDSQTGDRVHIDPSHRFLSLEVYEGVVNILPITPAGTGKGKGKRKAGSATHDIGGEIQDPIPVRIPELFVRSTCFLHKRRAGGSRLPNPELAILWEDSTNRVRLRVRELEYQPSLKPGEEPGSAELEKSRDVEGVGQEGMELGASQLIALPPPVYGCLVVGETSVSYVEEWHYRVADTVRLEEATVFVAWCAIDPQRYLLADDYGKLYLLFIRLDERDEYAGLQIDVLGETSRANTLVYLDAGRVFVGSHQGDSQVLQIKEGGGFEVLQTFANVAPILDFTIMDMGNRSADAPVNEFSSGQARIVTGSGAYRDGSLRSIRSGVGLEDVGSLGEMGEPVTAVFGLRSSSRADFQDVLVVSSVARTRVFKFDASGDVEEVEAFAGFEMGESSLYAGNAAQGACLQVTAKGVVVVVVVGDAEGGMQQASWTPPTGQTITDVSARDDVILLSLGGAALVLFQLQASELIVRAERHFSPQEQISCLALSPALPDICVVGFWQDSRISFLSLTDNLSALSTTSVSDDPHSSTPAVPRSLAIAQILPNQPPTLFIGLADGNVITYTIASPTTPFTARKSLILGTQQPNFSLLPRSSSSSSPTPTLQNVLATCENPSLIYGAEGRMISSAITADSASAICAFDSEAYGSVVVLATTQREGEVKLAVVDEERRTHVQTLPVHETVRRIAYSGTLKAFGLGTIQRRLREGTEEIKSNFRLVDEIALRELHAWELGEDELVECVIRASLDDGAGELAERWVVGTAFLDEGEDRKGVRGRLLVFEVTEERRLKLVVELGLKGACRCLGLVQGRIVAALVKTVVIYALEYPSPSSTPFLVKKAAYRTSTAPIDLCVTGSTIAVTDLMKSLSLLQYTPGSPGEPDSLVEIARHFDTLWGTAVAQVAPNTYLEADAEGNLLVLQHDINGYSVEDRRRLRVISEMLLGEMVNRIRPLAITPTASALVVPAAFLATVEGAIYLFGLIVPGQQDFLMRLQGLLAERVQSPGMVRFEKFRGFRNQVRDMGEEGPVRFVDGELIEGFLEASAEVQEEVCAKLGKGVEEVKGWVEGLRRMR